MMVVVQLDTFSILINLFLSILDGHGWGHGGQRQGTHQHRPGSAQNAPTPTQHDPADSSLVSSLTPSVGIEIYVTFSFSF